MTHGIPRRETGIHGINHGIPRSEIGIHDIPRSEIGIHGTNHGIPRSEIGSLINSYLVCSKQKSSRSSEQESN